MFSTCLFCHTSLGSNEVIETFPVGRRLAFDAERGRLWVVCRKCERWNLSPLDERWEAIEECERRFSITKLRVSTDNIGMTRLSEGLELVRIGRPLRPEFAAWRYGDQFGRRRIRTMIRVGVGLGALAGVVAGGAALGAGVGGFAWILSRAGQLIVQGNPRTVIARVAVTDGMVLPIQRDQLSKLALRPSTDALGWTLAIPRRGTSMRTAGSLDLTGDTARRAASQLLPALNRFGATRVQVSDAVKLLERVDTPIDLFSQTARSSRMSRRIAELPATARIALEMAAHEESERRAMEGELHELERAWRDAEEIAGIADNLLMPRGFEDLVARVRHIGT